MEKIEFLIGKYIKEKREQSLVCRSQESLADAVNLTRPTIVKIESGSTSTSFETIYDILCVLGTNFAEFEEFVKLQSVESRASREIVNENDLDIILKNYKEL